MVLEYTYKEISHIKVVLKIIYNMVKERNTVSYINLKERLKMDVSKKEC